MRALRLTSLAVWLPLFVASLSARELRAQNNVPQGAQPQPQQTLPPSATPTEPGTHNSQVTPASQAPKPVQQPDVRLDSKPHTDIDASVDSAPQPMDLGLDLGLGANRDIDLGHDIVAVTPPGMLSRSVPGNPRMVYFSLPVRAGDEITAADAAIIAARHEDLARAAKARGLNLSQSGWSYQQTVCPATQPDAEALVGVPAGDGQGAILLHFTRQDGDRAAAFTAVVPRANNEPVRAVKLVRKKVKHATTEQQALSVKKESDKAVNEALPPATLYRNLSPEMGWIAVSDCVAQVGGATPQIPNEPFLSEDILTAPTPLLKLRVDGEHDVIFTDRLDDSRYVVWEEHVSRTGKLLETKHEQVAIVARPVTNPPVPQPITITNIPQPPTRISPEPPSPLSGSKQ